MPVKILLINGPKRVGKTTIANLFHERLSQSFRVNMADRLKSMTNAFYNIRDQIGAIAPPDYMEEQKDIPMELFGGVSYRKTLIFISEEVIKPRHGDTVFGHWMTETMEKLWNGVRLASGVDDPEVIFIVADSGFASELVPIVERFGAQSVALVRLSGLNATFDGDSRSYVYASNVMNFRGNPGKYPIGVQSISSHNAAQGFRFEGDFVNYPNNPELTVRNIAEALNRANWLSDTSTQVVMDYDTWLNRRDSEPSLNN
jgi:hypothetical protein